MEEYGIRIPKDTAVIIYQDIQTMESRWPSYTSIDMLPDYVWENALSLLLGQLYVQRQWHFLHHLFGASYAIYLFSWFPQVASQQIFLGLTHAPWQVGGILAFFTGVYIPLLIYKWIVRHKQGHVGRYVALLTGHA